MVFANYKTLVSHIFIVRKIILGHLPGNQWAVTVGRPEMNISEHSNL